MIHVVIGTKAQYTKMAPLLRLMDERAIDYRLIDTGQHARFNQTLRPSLGVREPDVMLASDDARTLAQGLGWVLRMIGWWLRRRRLVVEIFGERGPGGICLVHGDTASTLVGALLARRAGLRVALVEAGLRSGNLFNPFPEEAIRRYVPRRSHLLLPPDETATRALERMRVRGRIVETSGNTVAEVLFDAFDAAGTTPVPGTGPVLVQLHRMENLHRRSRREAFIDLACRIARDHPVRFVVHPATHEILSRRGSLDRLTEAGVEISGLLPSYRKFVGLLASARFVITDGASLQEECAALGVPTLLWRAYTERPDGLDRNVVLAGYDPATIERFLDDPEAWRHPIDRLATRPSAVILDAVIALDDVPDAPGASE